MSQLVFLNERSLAGESRHPDESLACIDAFLAMMLELKKRMPELALVTREPLPAIPVAGNVTVRDWLSAAATRREHRQLLLGLAQRAPFRAARDLLGDPDPGVTEYVFDGPPFDGMRLEGIGLAHLYRAFAVSFDTDEGWRRTEVPLRFRCYTETGEDEGKATAHHATSADHIDGHREWLRGCVRRSIRNAADLWRRRTGLLPRLALLPRVESDLLALEPPAFRQVAPWLFAMNDAVDAWNPADAPAPEYPPHCTDESSSRKKLCWFYDRDGKQRQFTWHGRFTPGKGRIHFRLDGSTRTVVVAYIGPKLEA